VIVKPREPRQVVTSSGFSKAYCETSGIGPIA
jgi:hypothetical protein